MFKDYIREAAKIIVHCDEKEHTPQDFSELVRSLRENINCVPDDNGIKALKVILSILKNDVKIKGSVSEWAQKNGAYFAGNMVLFSTDKLSAAKFSKKYQPIFESNNFDLSTIVLYLSDIINDYSLLKNDFYLRNVEVVLRDDVVVNNNHNFINKGPSLATDICESLT